MKEDIKRYLEKLISWTNDGKLSWIAYRTSEDNFSYITYECSNNNVTIEFGFGSGNVSVRLIKDEKTSGIYLPYDLNELAYQLKRSIDFQMSPDKKKDMINKLKVFFGEER